MIVKGLFEEIALNAWRAQKQSILVKLPSEIIYYLIRFLNNPKSFAQTCHLYQWHVYSDHLPKEIITNTDILFEKELGSPVKLDPTFSFHPFFLSLEKTQIQQIKSFNSKYCPSVVERFNLHLLSQAIHLSFTDSNADLNELFLLIVRSNYHRHIQECLKHLEFSLTSPTLDQGLKICCENGYSEIFNHLHVHIIAKLKPTLLFFNQYVRLAAKNGHTKIVEKFLSTPAFVSNGSIVLCFRDASKSVHAKIIKLLLKQPQAKKIPMHDLYNALQNTLLTGCAEMMKDILDCRGEEIWHSEPGPLLFETSLWFAAQNNHVSIIDVLLTHDSTTHLPIKISPLQVAYLEGHSKVINKILSSSRASGISIDEIIDLFKIEPQNYSADAVHEIFTFLQLYFLEASKTQLMDLLLTASGYGDKKIIEAFLSSPRVSELDKDTLEHCLSNASSNGHEAIVQQWLACSQFKEISEWNLSLSFSLACMHGHKKIVELLINSKYSSTISDYFVRKAYKHAKEDGRDDILQLIQKFKPSIDSIVD